MKNFEGHHQVEDPAEGEESHESRESVSSPESSAKFHFKEMADIEPAMASLAEKLKENIESGKYDTLISDDAGGRIPTLILRKIIKELNPDKKLETYFIASGRTYLPDPLDQEKYEKLQEHLKKVMTKTKKALLVTQYIHGGDTMVGLAKALKDAGVQDFDVAAMDAAFVRGEDRLQHILGDNNGIYVGNGSFFHNFHEQHEKFGGVGKAKDYSPAPKRLVDVIPEIGRNISYEEWKQIFGIESGDSFTDAVAYKKKLTDPERNKEFDRRVHGPLTEDEKKEIQKNINLTREDVSLMAERIVKQVWGERK